jgi:hypothetical protein
MYLNQNLCHHLMNEAKKTIEVINIVILHDLYVHILNHDIYYHINNVHVPNYYPPLIHHLLHYQIINLYHF